MSQNNSKADSTEYARKMIFKLLERNGKRQVDLADAIGVSRFIVNQWKRGISNSFASAENINKISRYFGVTTDYIFGNALEWKDRPELFELLRVAKTASKADIEKVIKIIDILKE